MSKVELVVYDVLKNRGYSEECRFLVVSSTSGSGNNIAHLSVHVHEEEFEFGDGGINISLEPKSGENLMKSVVLGRTNKTHQEVQLFVKKLKNDKFKKSKYHAGRNNCVHFANELCKFLLGENIPREYLEAINHPFVQMFCEMTK